MAIIPSGMASGSGLLPSYAEMAQSRQPAKPPARAARAARPRGFPRHGEPGAPYLLIAPHKGFPGPQSDPPHPNHHLALENRGAGPSGSSPLQLMPPGGASSERQPPRPDENWLSPLITSPAVAANAKPPSSIALPSADSQRHKILQERLRARTEARERARKATTERRKAAAVLSI